MRQAAHRLTADDVWQLLRDNASEFGYELVNGELVEVMPASAPHGRLIGRMSHLLHAFLDESRIGRVYVNAGFVLQVPGDTERLREPDVAFTSNETLDAKGGEPKSGWIRFAPDLVVEIDSPSNTDEDVHEKLRDYLEGGVKLVWIIHLRSRTATVYRPDGSARLLRENDSLDGEDIIPGFRAALKNLLD
jgi:Uma2 family endonuclease